MPYQENGWDCGVYVCRYAYALFNLRTETFSPNECIVDQKRKSTAPFPDLITRNSYFRFDAEDILRIRREMRDLISNLSVVYRDWRQETDRAAKEKRGKKNRNDHYPVAGIPTTSGDEPLGSATSELELATNGSGKENLGNESNPSIPVEPRLCVQVRGEVPSIKGKEAAIEASDLRNEAKCRMISTVKSQRSASSSQYSDEVEVSTLNEQTEDIGRHNLSSKVESQGHASSFQSEDDVEVFDGKLISWEQTEGNSGCHPSSPVESQDVASPSQRDDDGEGSDGERTSQEQPEGNTGCHPSSPGKPKGSVLTVDAASSSQDEVVGGQSASREKTEDSGSQSSSLQSNDRFTVSDGQRASHKSGTPPIATVESRGVASGSQSNDEASQEAKESIEDQKIAVETSAMSVVNDGNESPGKCRRGMETRPSRIGIPSFPVDLASPRKSGRPPRDGDDVSQPIIVDGNDDDGVVPVKSVYSDNRFEC